MKEFLDISNTRIIQLEIGKPFGIFDKLKLKGIGSPRCIYLEGSTFLDEPRETSADLEFVNFEIYPNGLVGRYSKGNRKRGFAIKKDDIKEILITKSTILVKGNNAYIKSFETRYYGAYQATLEIKTVDNESLLFFVPPLYYESFYPYWKKSWLNAKTSFEISPEEPETDNNSRYFQILEAISNL